MRADVLIWAGHDQINYRAKPERANRQMNTQTKRRATCKQTSKQTNKCKNDRWTNHKHANEPMHGQVSEQMGKQTHHRTNIEWASKRASEHTWPCPVQRGARPVVLHSFLNAPSRHDCRRYSVPNSNAAPWPAVQGSKQGDERACKQPNDNNDDWWTSECATKHTSLLGHGAAKTHTAAIKCLPRWATKFAAK